MNIRFIITCLLWCLHGTMDGAASFTTSSTADLQYKDLKKGMAQLPSVLKDVALSYLEPGHLWCAGEYLSTPILTDVNASTDYRYSPDGSHVAFIESVATKRNLVVINAETHARIFVQELIPYEEARGIDPRFIHIKQPSEWFYAVFSWSRDGSFLVFRDGNSITVVQPLSESPEALFSVPGSSAAWSCIDNNILAVAREYGTRSAIAVYNVVTKGRIQNFSMDYKHFRRLLWHPKSNCIAAYFRGNGTLVGDLHFYNVSTAHKIYSIDTKVFHEFFLENVAFSADGLLLALGGKNSFALVDASTGKLQRAITYPQEVELPCVVEHAGGLVYKKEGLSSFGWLGNNILGIYRKRANKDKLFFVNAEQGTVVDSITYPSTDLSCATALDFFPSKNQLILSVQPDQKTGTKAYLVTPNMKALCATRITLTSQALDSSSSSSPDEHSPSALAVTASTPSGAGSLTLTLTPVTEERKSDVAAVAPPEQTE